MNLGDPTAFALLLLLGAMTGFISGLLGVGGGTIVVPSLLFGLPLMGISGPEMPKIAMATSLALVIPTTFASAQAHAARRGIDWYLWSLLAPSIITGAIFTALFAAGINNELLILLFILLVLMTAWKLIIPTSHKSQISTKPSVMLMTLKAVSGGALSSLLGLGVGWFTVPIMAKLTAMPRAIGTATALALPMAIAGTATYLMVQAPVECTQCTGFVALPVVAAIGLSAVLTAPFGAWAAHVMPVALLKRLFAVFLIIVAGDLAYKTFLPTDMTKLIKEAVALSKSHNYPATKQPQAAQAPNWLVEQHPIQQPTQRTNRFD